MTLRTPYYYCLATSIVIAAHVLGANSEFMNAAPESRSASISVSDVAITGLGSVGPYGVDRHARVEALRAGVSPHQKVSSFDASSFGCQYACPARDFEALAAEWIHERWRTVLPRSAIFSILATAMSFERAEIVQSYPDTDFVVGTSSPSMEDVVGPLLKAPILLKRYSEPDIAPDILLKTFLSAPASALAATFKTRGLPKVESTACASMFTALESAMLRVQSGLSSAAVAVAVDTPINWLTFLAFDRSKMLSHSDRARPLDVASDGGMFSEGSVAIHIEKATSARQRGAPVLIEIESIVHGYDGITVTHSADKSGEAWADFIRRALNGNQAVDAIALHAPGDFRFERLEFRALRSVFGSGLESIPVTSQKGAGSGLAYGGGAQLEAAIDMLLEQEIFPTMNLTQLRPEFAEYDVVRSLRSVQLNRILIPFRGFGGVAGAAVIKRSGA
ncbi:MAG: beta-ketoacyl synthase N-terminal-like domain-containing protein [Leptospirales bacterium]|jgi:3-oxoacyl-(acyl-carrier-protein) synthase